MLTGKDITAALLSLKPGVLWTMNGDNYENIVWESEETKPTYAELEAEVIRLEEERVNKIAAEEAAKDSAYSKLAALGLTVEELKAALGSN